MILITIDGSSGSLKTTMANKLTDFGVRVLHADDFFYPFGEKKHPASGNFNAPFFIENVLPKALEEEAFEYFAFDCKTQKYYKKHAPAAKITVLEGSYSSTQLLDKYRDASLFIKTDLKACKKRVRRRVGTDNFKAFEERWMPQERKYFIKNRNYKKSILVESYNDVVEIIIEYM